MRWEGTEEQHRQLLMALKEAVALYGESQIATSLTRDQRTVRMAEVLGLPKHSPINRTTLMRWVNGLDRDPALPIPDEVLGHFRQNASFARKQLLYDFLQRSEAIRTSLYDPAPGLPQGFDTFLSNLHGPLSRLRFHDLNNLDGTYALHRKAWTTPDRLGRVLISKLVIETISGLTRFREEQDYRDDQRGNMPVKEIDHGLVFNSGINLFLLGFGQDEARVKHLVVHAWHPAIDGEKPVYELKGIMIGASGDGPHPGYRFIAYRSDDPDGLKSRVVSASEVGAEVIDWISEGS